MRRHPFLTAIVAFIFIAASTGALRAAFEDTSELLLLFIATLIGVGLFYGVPRIVRRLGAGT